MMLKLKIKKIFMIFIWLLICNICYAQTELADKSKEAKQSDLIGCWRMTYQTVSPLFNDKSLFFADYQIFQFFEDGFVKNIASKKRLKTEEISRLLQKSPKLITYEFIGKGLLIIERSKNNFDDIAISITVYDFNKKLRSTAPLLKRGDLIVSYRDREQNLYMQRYLRRLDLSLN